MKMNLLSKALLFGGAIAMVACSSDEPVVGGSNNPNTPTGDEAFLNINIRNANGGDSRATAGGYEYGDLESESKVEAAKFLFFDEEGNYMNIQANKWSEGGEGTNENIEHFGANTIVLRGLKGTDSYPTYMMVVLNCADFVPGATLQETADKLVGITNNDHFVMSTTSFFGGTDPHHVDDYYYATKLSSDDFMKEPAEQNGSNVNVYVERVAAKVTFDASEDLKKTAEMIDGTEAFPISITLGGTNNDQETGLVEGDNQLYIRILGWGLNATATESYLSKKLDAAWATTAPWAKSEWDNADYHRSFWGQSVLYGQDIATDNVVYTDYSSLAVALSKPAYTHENTNTAEKVSVDGKLEKLDRNAITSILAKAQVINKEGKGVNLIEIYGRYYTYNGFKGLVASNMATLGSKMNFYYITGTHTEQVPVVYPEDVEIEGVLHIAGEQMVDEDGNLMFETVTLNDYKQLGTDQLEIAKALNAGTGIVTIRPVEEFPAHIYKEVDGKYIEYGEGEAYAAFEKDLAEVLESYPSKITAFEGGAMYYNIPVEHLNEDNVVRDAEGVRSYNGISEGNYGIVRNHHYKVTFSKLAKLGHGVFVPGTGSEDPNPVPGEPIIPDDNEDDTYYLGSTINILSWKVVSQDVEL